MTFEQALTILLRYEGGYVNNPRDPGGETNFGITRRLALRYGYIGDMRDIPKATVASIYRAEFWDKIRAHELHHYIRYPLFDFAVHSGVKRAVMELQAVSGCVVDGIIGKQTLAKTSWRTICDIEAVMIATKLTASRLKFLTCLTGWPEFGKGWARRIADILKM